MKKFFMNAIFLFIMVSSCITVKASGSTINWYCKHRSGHMQPITDTSLAFIDEYDAFYIDKKHDDNCKDKVIYLTFDAGYNNGNIDRILDILKAEQVPAAFFILGHLIESDTELVKRMFEEGHTVCNHTYSHKKMVQIDEDMFKSELEKLEATCIELTGKSISKYYRPPQGIFDEVSLKYAQKLGYKTIFWSFAYDDWDNNNQKPIDNAKKKILDNLHNGEIMLLHPTSSTNAEILGDIIKEIKDQGYRFGKLDEI